MTSVLDVDSGPMKAILEQLRGALRGLIVNEGQVLQLAALLGLVVKD